MRGGGQPLQMVLGGPDYARAGANGAIACWRASRPNPGLSGVDSDYKETRPQMRVVINRDRAADLGVSVSDIGNTLQTMIGSRRVTTFVDAGKEYDVLVQAERKDRSSIADLENLYVRARGGNLVPMSSVVSVTEIAEAGQPQSLQPPALDHDLGATRARLSAGRGDRLGAHSRPRGTCRRPRKSTSAASRANT